MLTFYGAKTNGPIPIALDAELPPTVDWIDALDPTASETAFLSRVMGVAVPTRADLVEIESSSRLSTEGDTIRMSLPATVRDATGYPESTPIGFVIDKDKVATIRFRALPTLEAFSKRICDKGALSPGGLGATVSLLEVIIDHMADVLEHVGSDLDTMSRGIFATGVNTTSGRPRQANEALRGLLQAVGRNSDLVSKVSESLLGIGRMSPFLTAKGAELVTPDLKTRLAVIGQDTHSLHEYQEHLAEKTQFLLDTLLGLANIEQNNVFRVLTIVSVIGIPPTFFASMYGMNFKGIPEYDWTYGYAYGLTLIVCSGLLPALWFKFKGWW